MRYLVIGSGVVWVLGMMDRMGIFPLALYFSPYHILRGEIWRLFTFVLVPESYGFGYMIVIELYFNYFIGTTLEREWGHGKFTIYYLMGMLLTVLYGMAIWLIWGVNLWATAHFLNLSMFFAFATLFPDTRVLLFFVLPIKVKWLALVDAVYFVYALMTLPFPGKLLPLVATLNYLLFCAPELLANLTWSYKAQTSPKRVEFKREISRIKHQRQADGYTKKCEVCGRTDANSPNLEFRYCSRCQGFHCYCEDHINNHVHVEN